MNGIAKIQELIIQSLNIIHKSLIKKFNQNQARINKIGTRLNKNSSQNNVNFSSENEGFQFSECES
jgi:sensor domain CHASE-containing protein